MLNYFEVEMKNEEKTCRNCKYVRQHYAIFLGKFTKVPNVYHCTNCDNVTKKQFEACIKKLTACAYWQSDEEKKQDDLQDVRKALITLISHTVLEPARFWRRYAL